MRSVAKEWIKKLKSRGINTYKFSDLPEDLKNLTAHRRAISKGLVKKIGVEETGQGIWRVNLKK